MKNSGTEQNSSINKLKSLKTSSYEVKILVSIYFLPLFYIVTILINSFFNIYSNISFLETLLTLIISTLTAFAYSNICAFIVKFFYKKKDNINLNKTEGLKGAAFIVFVPGGVLVTGGFLSLYIFFAINPFAGLILFAGIIGLTLFSFVFSQKLFKKIFNVKISKTKNFFASILLVILVIVNPVVLLSYIPIRYEFFDIQMIESRGMQETLSPGNIVIIDKISGLTNRPSHQGLVYLKSPISNSNHYPFSLVFKGLKNNDLHYIRRISAIPGDTINLNSYSGYILNGKVIHEDYLKEPDKKLICRLAFHCDKITISKNSYYLLGDNRNASQDSRIWSEVNNSFLKGKVHSIIWPKSRFKRFP